MIIRNLGASLGCGIFFVPLRQEIRRMSEVFFLLVDEFFDEVGIVPPGDDVVPFRVLTDVAVAVAEAFGGGEAERRHLGIALRALG